MTVRIIRISLQDVMKNNAYQSFASPLLKHHWNPVDISLQDRQTAHSNFQVCTAGEHLIRTVRLCAYRTLLTYSRTAPVVVNDLLKYNKIFSVREMNVATAKWGEFVMNGVASEICEISGYSQWSENHHHSVQTNASTT